MSKYLPNPQSVKAVAAAYTSDLHFAVVPVSGKIPEGVRGWQKGSICTPSEVERVFRPHHNVGIVTGRYEHDDQPNLLRLWVLDVDWKEETILPEDATEGTKPERVAPTWGEDGRPVRTPDTNLTKDGYASLDALTAEHGPLPATWTVRTGGGGTHYYWRIPEGVEVPGTTDIRPFIDIRGSGGQVVAPPSMHPETGVEYAWHPQSDTVVEAPQWLLDLALAKTREREARRQTALAAAQAQRAAAPQGEASSNPSQAASREYGLVVLGKCGDDVRGAERGLRTKTLFTKTFKLSKLYGSVLSEDEILTAMTAAGLDAGLPEGEVERAVNNGFAQGEAQRDEAYPVTPTSTLAAGQTFMQNLAVLQQQTRQNSTPPPPPPSNGGGAGTPPPPPPGGNGTPPPAQAAPAAQPAGPGPRPPLAANQINVHNVQRSTIMRAAWTRLQSSETLFLDEERRLIEYEARDAKSEPLLMTGGRFYLHLTNCGDWVEQSFSQRRGWITMNVRPPGDIAPAMMADTDAPLRVLKHIGRTPLLTDIGGNPDGTRRLKLMWSGGYDAESHTFMLNHGVEHTQMSVEESVEVLNKWTADWGFATEHDRTNALALFLLPFVRPAIRGPTPMHLAEASEVDFGKSRIIRTMLTPAMGTPPGPSKIDMTDETEFDKKIVAYLRAKQQAMFFDNVRADKGPLENGVLEMLLTDERYTGRILGKSEMGTFLNTAAWAMTMNSGSLGPDLMRRTVCIRLATRPPAEAERKIANIIEWTVQFRHVLVSAAWTLIEHWLAKGCPRAAQPLNSFEAWSNVVGGILECAGFATLDGNRNEARERLSGIEMDFIQFVNAWASRYKEGRVEIAKLRQLADDNDVLQSKVRGPAEQNGKAPERDRSMGVFLASRNEVVRDGYRLRMGYTNGARRYWLEKTKERLAQEEADAKMMAVFSKPNTPPNIKP
jgi:hypothetical protein